MTMYDRAPAPGWTASPARRVIVLLALALGLVLLPPAWTGPVRSLARTALRPGQIAATLVGDSINSGLAYLRGACASSQRYAALERQLEQLRVRNAQLEAAAVVLARSDLSVADSLLPVQNTQPLIATQLIEARVIGRHLQSLLRHQATLDLGAADGLQPGAWTIDDAGCLIDQGQRRRGELVLAGRRVLGKISETSRHTSRVQRPTDAGYRDLVQLAYRQGARVTLGPRGVLEGTGEPLCRVRMIPVTESVSTGDILLTAGSEGVASCGLVYGEIVRVERPAGATHWEIWVRPAANGMWPDRVAVVAATADTAAAAMASGGSAGKERR